MKKYILLFSLLFASSMFANITEISDQFGSGSEWHFNSIIKQKPYVVAKFYAPWCGTCQLIEPLFEKVAKNSEFKKISFVAVNTSEHSNLTKKYRIQGIPTTIYFKHGKEVDRKVGGDRDFDKELSKKIREFAK